MRASSKRSSTRLRERAHLVAHLRQVVGRAARPSSTASSIACIDASGVRRSWLAWATSSRRASKSRSSSPAIRLKDGAELGELGRARLSARAPPGRRPRAPRWRARTSSAGSRPSAPTSEGGDERGDRRRRRRRRGPSGRARVEHEDPRQQDRGERQQDARAARARRAAAAASAAAAARARPRTRPRASRRATTSAIADHGANR